MLTKDPYPNDLLLWYSFMDLYKQYCRGEVKLETIILSATGIMRGISSGNEQSYVVIGVDKYGNQYHIIFACKMNYTDSVEKGLGKLIPIRNAASDVSATMNTLGEVVDD